ncbi:MAG TPA: HipA family kinase [Candidatus Baltobacteraceae bacterium]|jgi:hypothetical protein|nr:HipA family kinase [Candidatus Baltobacteraceae bacterium]
MPLQITEARIDRGVVKHTFNSPHRIEGSDGLLYVVKPRRNDRQFANEVLAAALGEALDLPMPDAALVTVDELFRAASPTAAAKYELGIHFATRFETNSWTFDNPAPALAISEIRNLEKMYSLVAFDEVVANVDRKTNVGNNMVVQVSESSPRYNYMALDHGHILTGPQWTPESLRGYDLAPIVPVFRFVETCLTSLPRLQEAAAELDALREGFARIVSGLRTELSQEDQGAIVEFLRTRAAELPNWVVGERYRQALGALQP